MCCLAALALALSTSAAAGPTFATPTTAAPQDAPTPNAAPTPKASGPHDAPVFHAVPLAGGADGCRGVPVVDGASPAAGPEAKRAARRLRRARQLVRERFIHALPEAALCQGSLPELMAGLDGHSAYLSPEVEAAMGRQSAQRYGGIGVKLGPGGVILGRDPEGPALRAGLRLGDQLVAVDGRSVKGRSPSAVSVLLQGPVGSELRLRLRSARDGTEYRRSLRRAALSWPTVRARRLGGLLYVKIRGFQTQTPSELAAVLEGQPNIEGLILDLRGNPGGELGAAVRVADRWLSGGQIAAIRRRGVAVKVERAHPRGTAPTYPIAVLIDKGTASAAELLAAALVERGRARSFGRPSFGKSHVQTMMHLPGGGALRLTVARYLTPSGRDLEGRGLAPQAPTPPGAGPAAALRAATAWLRSQRSAVDLR